MPETDQLEALLAWCVADGRVCPHPLDWKRLWETLPGREYTGSGWRPALPLILAAWWSTTDDQKRDRLREHIEWAAAHGALDRVELLLRGLADDRWHYATPPEVIVVRRAERQLHRHAIEQLHESNRRERLVRAAGHGARKTEADARHLSSLAPALLAAYRATAFHVFAQPPFALRIDERSKAVAALMAAHDASCAAFITAWNPESEPTSDAANAEAQRRLAAAVERGGYKWLPGEGRGATSDWPAEESLLVLGLPRGKAKELGRTFRQNAVVWVGTDAVPELILLPTDR